MFPHPHRPKTLTHGFKNATTDTKDSGATTRSFYLPSSGRSPATLHNQPKSVRCKKSSRKAARHAGDTSSTSFFGQTREIALSHIRFDSLVPFTFGIVIEPLRESANIALWQSLDGFLDFLDRAHERDLGRLRIDRQAPAKS